MARKKPEQPEKPEQPSLKVARSQAEELVDKQIEAGRTLVDRAQAIATGPDYEAWCEDRIRWRKFTEEALKTLYTNDAPAVEFSRGPSIGFIAMGERSIRERLADDLETHQRHLNNLLSLRERLALLPSLIEAESGLGAATELEPGRVSPRVFVVHGHDEATKEKVIRQLEKAGAYEVVVLHEQPHGGKTLIEKLEEHASRSDFAVVLLTPDDVGASASDEPDLSPRGRQNVVFELGFFVGALGRSQVAVLYDESVELPSDFKGVAYVALGDDSWRFKLLKELKAAGFNYDLNEILT